jgi:hypothetical protein
MPVREHKTNMAPPHFHFSFQYQYAAAPNKELVEWERIDHSWFLILVKNIIGVCLLVPCALRTKTACIQHEER